MLGLPNFYERWIYHCFMLDFLMDPDGLEYVCSKKIEKYGVLFPP